MSAENNNNNGNTSKRKKSTLEETLKKYRKGEKAASKIMIDVARDRAALDARSEAQQERVRRQQEQERQRQEEKMKKMATTQQREIQMKMLQQQQQQHGTQQQMDANKPIHVPQSLLARQKAAIDLLRRTREKMTNTELKALLGFDVLIDKTQELFKTLERNEKVKYCAKTDTLKYQPKYDIQNRDDLFQLVLKHADGILEEDVNDCYDLVLIDSLKLEQVGAVWRIQNSETRKFVIYPRYKVGMEDDENINNNSNNDTDTVKGKSTKNDNEENEEEDELEEEFVKMYADIKVPDDDAEFDNLLRKNNIEPAQKRSFRKVSKEELEEEKKKMKKKKRAPNFERMKLTNVHMKEMFKGAAPDRLV
jgi:transcription initiation factor TFIIE subunit beta